jgi:hypothetical protein
MKVYFTAEEMHTPEYREYVKWMSECWRLNDERNKRIEAEKLVLIEKTRPIVTDEMLTNARKLAKKLYQKQKDAFYTY